jgi:hypothetical protein
MELHKGGRPSENQSQDASSLPKLSEIGINKDESNRWQKIASIPEPDFEIIVSDANVISQTALLKQANKLKKEAHDVTLKLTSIELTHFRDDLKNR